MANLMEVGVNYKLFSDMSDIKSEGEAKATLDEQYLTLNLMFGDPMLLAYTDIVEISEYDYKVDFFLISKEKLNLCGLGYQYEDFLFQLYKFRNEQMLKYLLMQESVFQAGFEAQFTQFDVDGQIGKTGSCELRLYDTALVVLPQKDEPIRLPYCYVKNISKQDYKLILTNEFQEKIEVSRLGQNFDPFAKALSDSMNRMTLRTQAIIKELIPEATPMAINKLASLMKDGRAAKRKEIEQQTLDFWSRLTKTIDEANLTPQYEFLNSSSSQNQVCVGIKRGLMGNLTGTYVWMLFPLLNQGTNRLSNLIALEAFNTQEATQNSQESGQTNFEPDIETGQNQAQKQPATTGATYFFRLTSRNRYSQSTDLDVADNLDTFIQNITRALIEINFRREPIYLSDYDLESTKYAQYRFAIAKIPSLKTLRNQFVGRVIHASQAQWEADVKSLLAFNAENIDDAEKWSKGD